MVPPTKEFPLSELESRIQITAEGTKRRHKIDLLDCPLKQLIQYRCEVEGWSEGKKGQIVCEPVVRLFRVCANGLSVETTRWEAEYGAGKQKKKQKSAMKS